MEVQRLKLPGGPWWVQHGVLPLPVGAQTSPWRAMAAVTAVGVDPTVTEVMHLTAPPYSGASMSCAW